MPTFIKINGIDIDIYHGDHNPPHIHVKYNEYEIRIRIANGTPLKGGYMPAAQLRTVKEWLKDEKNREDVLTVFKALNPNLRS